MFLNSELQWQDQNFFTEKPGSFNFKKNADIEEFSLARTVKYTSILLIFFF